MCINLSISTTQLLDGMVFGKRYWGTYRKSEAFEQGLDHNDGSLPFNRLTNGQILLKISSIWRKVEDTFDIVLGLLAVAIAQILAAWKYIPWIQSTLYMVSGQEKEISLLVMFTSNFQVTWGILLLLIREGSSDSWMVV